eukprot:CAMPEP_0176364566 /NCGR_PEP_ID=MMETSP0126-20121128/19878_1 /TAXON_ID=141414 ORGANISM="Strombidinopsis acuminatum, Strain SPMC142" /NCGR_SAMPLE_ID=MMETSP0126 /ASSEMBLY_ACC=CAM_ASM_000229 /LENGTH=109 /DNA_ID=CAMNT_0017721255 /DNA_START=165 /DNA_END=493 /DNA_ORIENTATION=-
MAAVHPAPALGNASFALPVPQATMKLYIRVQTNGLPNHCYQATNENPSDVNLDYKVKFNMDVSGRENISADQVDSADATSELLCDLMRTASSNMFSDLDYTETDVRREL